MLHLSLNYQRQRMRIDYNLDILKGVVGAEDNQTSA